MTAPTTRVSILNMTDADKSAMTDAEQHEFMIDQINHAAETLRAVVACFGERMRPTDSRALLNSAAEAVRISRLQD